MSAHHFDLIAKIMSDDERFLTDKRTNTGLLSSKKQAMQS
jgi:hypothetical protein